MQQNEFYDLNDPISSNEKCLILGIDNILLYIRHFMERNACW